MDTLISVIGCMLIFISIVGYSLWIHKRLDISLYIVPIWSIAVISLCIYFSGFLGWMLIVSYLLFVIGIGLFVYQCLHLHKIYWDDYPLLIIVICFLFIFIVFMILTFTTKMIHYDNYSHWMLVVKELLITDHFITADNLMIEFTNYPLGSASFIYYVCKIAGHAQGVMLYAQSLVIFSCFLAMFSIIKEKKRLLLMAFLAAGLCILSYFNLTVRINNLLVDFLLPIIALAAVSASYCYRNEADKALLANFPLLALLTIIKSTGIIYVVIALVYLGYIVFKNTWKNARIQDEGKIKMLVTTFVKLIIGCVFIFIPYLSWQNYVADEFSQVENKFELTSDKLSSVYAGKTIEDVYEIIELYKTTLLDVHQRATQGIIFYHVVVLAACSAAYVLFKKKWKLYKLLLWLDLVLVAYFIGILLMYIYSMPLDEAIYLAGYERYASSIVIFFAGALTIGATCDLEASFHYRLDEVEKYKAFKSITTKKMYNIGTTICLMFIYLMMSSELNGIQYNNEIYTDSFVALTEEIVGDSWQEVDLNRYLIYVSDNDAQLTSYYAQYVTRYYLRSPYVDGICMFYEDNMLNLLSQYDYLIVFEIDDDLVSLMKKYFDISISTGIYKIEDLLENIEG